MLGGEGPLFNEIVNYVNSDPILSQFVRVLESVKRIGTFYAACDILLHTARMEGLGQVILEANSHGKPVVAADAGAIPEIIEHGSNGFIYPVGNPEEAACLLLELYSDSGFLEKVGNDSREHVRQTYSISRMIDAYIKLNEEINKYFS